MPEQGEAAPRSAPLPAQAPANIPAGSSGFRPAPSDRSSTARALNRGAPAVQREVGAEETGRTRIDERSLLSSSKSAAMAYAGSAGDPHAPQPPPAAMARTDTAPWPKVDGAVDAEALRRRVAELERQVAVLGLAIAALRWRAAAGPAPAPAQAPVTQAGARGPLAPTVPRAADAPQDAPSPPATTQPTFVGSSKSDGHETTSAVLNAVLDAYRTPAQAAPAPVPQRQDQ